FTVNAYLIELAFKKFMISSNPSLASDLVRPHAPSINPRRLTMNGARPYKSFLRAPSYETRPFLKSSAVKISYRSPWVPTVNRKFTIGSTKYHTAEIGRKGKAIKPSACWTWNPSQELPNKGPNNNSVSVMFKKYTYIDTQGRHKSDSGCSRHMTGNISYLSNFEPFDGGYVSFGQGGCKITGNGTIKTDSECIVLGRNFKLLDDTNILLRTPRQHNMYSIDLNNIVSLKDLTCLVAKASADECILWHRRLGSGPTWLFDIDTLTKSMNYQPVTAGNQSNPNAGVQEQFDTEKAREDNVQQYVIFPLWSSGFNDPQNTDGDATFEVKEPEFEVEKPDAAGPSNTDVSPTHGKSSNMDPSQYPDDPNMLALEDITYSDDEEDVDQGGLTQINNEDFHTCMFACFISQEEPKRVHQALKDPSWIEAMQEELLQFKMQKVWILVDLPNGKRAIGTKWVLRNKKDERGIVVKNKA
nr:putative ribonuclease H-like domain-containing protein [Tanacetum cinerariifolium]